MRYIAADMRRRGATIGIYAIFFLSGAAGLVYQVVWSRLLNEVFGITTYAVTVVLATFLGGLALGGAILGRGADRSRSPLRLYGMLEMGVGLTALAGTWVIRAFDPLHAWAATRLAPDSIVLMGVRLLVASIVILPPTMMMGATLPAVTRVFVEDVANLGRRLSLLYALNTAGAVVGSILAAFFLIRAIGVHPTLWVAVATNVAAAVIALSLSPGRRSTRAIAPGHDAPPGSSRGTPARSAVSKPAMDQDAMPAAPRDERWILAAMAASGVASLSLEVVWTRMLVLVLGTSTYAFATMLSTFLVGISAGGLLARAFVDRLRNPRRTFGLLQVAIAVSSLASVLLARRLIEEALPSVERLELSWMALAGARFGLSFLVMIVPTTLIGITFPLAARIWSRGVRTLGGDLGRLYGANTAGNIAGAALGGFVVLPFLGMQRGVAVLATLNLASGGWALLPTRTERAPILCRWRLGLVLGGTIACIAALLTWRPAPLPATGGGPTDAVLYYREGVVSTVKVVQRAEDGRQRLMAVDGVTIGQSSTGVDRKQQVLAHLPFLLASDRPIRSVLSIGLGTGILIGEVARHPEVRRAECVELSRSVVEGARFFSADNGDVLANPTVRIVTDDGVNHLRRSRARFDVIISDGKSKSGHSGNAVFYSRDYYRSARAHLAQDGMMVQWVPLDMTPDDQRVVLRTFTSVFPHVFVWLGQDASFLVGREAPLVVDLAHVQRVLDAPACADLRRHGWRHAADVVSLLVADGPSLRRWLTDLVPVNSLEHPVLEFYSLAAVEEPEAIRSARNAVALLRAGAPGPRDVTWVGDGASDLAAASRSVHDFSEGALALALGDPGGMTALRRALAAAPRGGVLQQWGATILFQAARDLDLRGDPLHAIDLYRESLRAWPRFLEAHLNLGRAYGITGWRDLAAGEYQEALRIDPDSAIAHGWLAELARGAGDLSAAIDHGRAAVRISPRDARLRDDLGLSLATAGRLEEALSQLREAARLDPGWPMPLDRAALVLISIPAAGPEGVSEAVALARRALELTHAADPMALETLAAAYAAGGRFQEAVAIERQAMDAARASAGAGTVATMASTLRRYELGERLTPLARSPR